VTARARPAVAGDPVAHDPVVLDPEERIEIATFAVGDDTIGVDIMRIREIVRPERVTPVPGSPPHIRGVLRLRGALVPVVDLTVRFARAKDSADEADPRFVVLTVDGRPIAVVVDKVGDVLTVQRRDIRLARDTLSGASARAFVGVVAHKDRVVLLMHARRVLDDATRVDVLGLEDHVPHEGTVDVDGNGRA